MSDNKADDTFSEHPFLRTSSTLSPSPPLSFSTIIDQDHSQINALSLKLGKLLSPKLTQTPELRNQQLDAFKEVTWRLVRHDISEEIVMRPAMEMYLGQEGKAMARHDREDHEGARRELVCLFEEFERLGFEQTEGNRKLFLGLRKRYIELMGELTEHMKTESGMDIPRLEGVVGKEISEELGRLYLKTYALGPGLRWRGRNVWEGGVGQYVRDGEGRQWRVVWKEICEDDDVRRKSRL